MSALISAAETIGTLVASGYAAHKIENLMIRAKVLPHPLEDELGDVPPTIQRKIDTLAVPAWTKQDEDMMIALFRDVPSAYWLDPARWGTPDVFDNRENFSGTPLVVGRTRIKGNFLVQESADQPVALDAPPCPACKVGRRTVMAIHDGEATMWDCFDCGCEFTRAGETKKSRKARLAREADMLPPQLAHPPRITEQPDKTIQRARRDQAWEYRAAQCFAGKAENHGSCPEPCGMPVDKRGGMYYCSDSGCKRHREGWK